MAGNERLAEEAARAVCHTNSDCARYSMCLLSNGCRCQAWGKCELVRIAGQPCHTDPQCAVGLVCRETSPPDTNNRCGPNTRLEDLPRFADLPETDMDTLPDIKPTYVGPILVAGLTTTLVIMSLAFAFWFRYTAPSAQPCQNIEMTSPSSVLVDTIHTHPSRSYLACQLTPVHHPVVSSRDNQHK